MSDEPTEASTTESVRANRLVYAYVVKDYDEVARFLEPAIQEGNQALSRLAMTLAVDFADTLIRLYGQEKAAAYFDHLLDQVMFAEDDE